MLDAATIPPKALALVDSALAPSVVPDGVDVNSLPKEEQKALIRAQMAQERAARKRVRANGG